MCTCISAVSAALKLRFRSCCYICIQPTRSIHSFHWRISVIGQPVPRDQTDLSSSDRKNFMTGSRLLWAQAFACSPGKSSTRAPTTITGVRSDDCAKRHSQSSTSDRAQSGVTTALQKKRKAYARDENATTESTGLSELLGPQPLRLILVG
jgi:hypothetical protein